MRRGPEEKLMKDSMKLELMKVRNNKSNTLREFTNSIFTTQRNDDDDEEDDNTRNLSFEQNEAHSRKII